MAERDAGGGWQIEPGTEIPLGGGGELPVGTVILLDNAIDDPNVLLGYGTWELMT